jgi:hypothetical protein
MHGIGFEANTHWKKSLLTEIAQLKRQLEAQILLNKPESETLIEKYQLMIAKREQVYNGL